MNDIIIIVPLYKQPNLLPGLFQSIIDEADDIKRLNGRILLINDSPDHEPLREALETELPRLASHLRVEVLTNPENLGFVKSCNRGLEKAVDEDCDVLLLNSDALFTRGSFAEIAAVAHLDPLISVVSPRSNNATICNSPYPDRFRSLPLDHALEAHRVIQMALPRVTYVPTAVGFCLYIRNIILKEFGLLDTIYGAGYNEENDFILRCNERGYRAVLANHAFVYHIGSSSFSESSVTPNQRNTQNHKILIERYPFYDRAIQRYFDGSDYAAQRLLAGIVPSESGKLKILFDCHNIGTWHAGTFENAKKTIEKFVASYHEKYEVFISCSYEALKFHGFDKIIFLNFCWGNERQMAPFSAVIRLAQPFNIEQMYEIVELAPVSCFMMLDTIALDCQQLDDQDFGRIWLEMLDISTTIGFISQFSSDQFKRRFAIPKSVVDFVALCSTDASEYRSGDPAKIGSAIGAPEGEVLIIGNHFPHKFVRETVDLIKSADPNGHVVVLGIELPEMPNLVCYKSGELDQGLVDSLYDRCSVVLFPSHYEGFGLPVMHALSRNKPVIVRNLPVMNEIKEKSEFGDNIYLCSSTSDMVQMALSKPKWRNAAGSARALNDWNAVAAEIEKAIARSIGQLSYEDCRRKLARISNARSNSSHGHEVSEPVKEVGAISAEVRPSNRPKGSSLKARFGQAKSKLYFGYKSDLSLTANRSLRYAKPNSYLKIAADARDSELTDEVLLARFFDWAEILTLGGRLELVVAKRDGVLDSSPFGVRGLRDGLTGAGFKVRSIDETDGEIIAQGTKITDWLHEMPQVDDDEKFLEEAYQAALGRPADGSGKRHFGAAIAEGSSHKEVFRALLASPERMKRLALREVE